MEALVVSDYALGLSTQRIASMRGLKQSTVFAILKRLGVQTRSRQDYRVHSFNETYFETIDSHEKACILGFLYADGCIYHRRAEYVMAIGLSVVDRAHLEWIAKCMKFTGPITNRGPASPLAKIASGPSVRIDISSKKLFYDLCNLGLHQRKSLTLRFPTNTQVPDEFVNSFLLGYFEGDGWIYEHSGRQDVGIGIISTFEFTASVQALLRDRLGINVMLSQRMYEKNVRTLRIAGARQAISFLEWIYRDCPHRMPRKHEIFARFRARYDAEDRFIETDEWRAAKAKKVSDASRNMTDEQRAHRRERIMAKCRRYQRPFSLKAPDGTIYHVNLKAPFAREMNMDVAGISLVANGHRPTCNGGWTKPTDDEVAGARAAGTLIEKSY